MNKKDIQTLLNKVEKVTKEKKLDLSADEDLSIAIMNLISIEEHLFFTSQKTGKPEYLDLLNEIRSMRTELLKKIIKDYEGEVWCISKHLLAASMRLMEVGTKELKKAAGAERAEAEEHKNEAGELFKKSYKLYSLFWGINLNVIKMSDVKKLGLNENILMTNDQGPKTRSASIFDKLGTLVQKAIDCCRE